MNNFCIADYNNVFHFSDTRIAGSCHDSTIFDRSVVLSDLEKGWGWGGAYYGDKAFTRHQKYVVTRFRPYELSDDDWERECQNEFNHCQSAVRSVVESSFGILKGKFAFLRNGMRGQNYAANQEIIVAAMVLHNLQMAHSGLILEVSEKDIQRYRANTSTLDRNSNDARATGCTNGFEKIICEDTRLPLRNPKI